MTPGIKLNNPFDLKVSPYFSWQGETIETTGEIDGLCEFDTLADGLRAGFKDLFNAWQIDGLTTLKALVYHYAPPPENDSEAYLSGVCQSTGWFPDQNPELNQPANLLACGRAFLIEEQGQDYVTSIGAEILDRAVTAAHT